VAKKYRRTFGLRLANTVVRGLLRLGVKMDSTYMLSVVGRKSGKLHATPVNLVEDGDQRWLVGPYGEVNWVWNARASRAVMLTRGWRSETVRLVELGPEESAPVLKRYLEQNAITRPYFDAAPDAPVEAFRAEAARHPVFRIVGPA
jgi:deazaflavin-dependent oxidoreductase (nitroreductase family)